MDIALCANGVGAGTKGSARSQGLRCLRRLRSLLRFGRRIPRVLFGSGEQRFFAQERAHSIEAHFGRRMQPAEGAHASKARWQDVLEEPAHELQRFQSNGDELAGFALAIGPQDFAFRQQCDFAIGGGGLEDVAGEIA